MGEGNPNLNIQIEPPNTPDLTSTPPVQSATAANTEQGEEVTSGNISGDSPEINISAKRPDKTVGSPGTDNPRESDTLYQGYQTCNFPSGQLYLDDYNSPIPPGVAEDLPVCLPRNMNVLAHPAISGKTMTQFRIELDRPAPLVTEVGMLFMLRTAIEWLVDAGHGPPQPFAVQSINWAEGLDRRGLRRATMCFTISLGAYGAAATIASLCLCAHGRYQPTMLSFPVVDAEGHGYNAILTSMDFERWLQDRLRTRRIQQHQQLQRQVAAEVRAGRIRITIMHPPGRPLLSESEAADMISHYFGESSGPRQVTLKDGNGLKIEGVGNLHWEAHVAPLDRWPTKLLHPTMGKHFYYTYLLESAHSRQHGLCGSCHQPDCGAKNKWACRVYKKSLYSPYHSDGHIRPMRGYTTLQHAESQDPIVRMLSHPQ